MRMSFVLCAVIFLAVAARAQDSGPVRAELSAALEGRAAALAPNAELRDYAALFPLDERPKAKARLDGLDRSKLSAADLRELSEAYVLLGYFDAGASVGRTFQDRDPSGTEGLKLAAVAKLEAKDYAGAAALAQEALMLNPRDKDAAGLLYTARGRGAASDSSPAGSNQAPPPPSEQSMPVSRAPLVFTDRPRSGVPRPFIPSPAESANEAEGMVSRSSKWVKRNIEEAPQAIVRLLDRTTGLRPGEEESALAGARNGAVVGAGLGMVGGAVVAAGPCAPGLVTGLPYGLCVAAGGAGGALFMIPVTAYAGGWVYVKYQRGVAFFEKDTGFDLKASSKAE